MCYRYLALVFILLFYPKCNHLEASFLIDDSKEFIKLHSYQLTSNVKPTEPTEKYESYKKNLIQLVAAVKIRSDNFGEINDKYKIENGESENSGNVDDEEKTNFFLTYDENRAADLVTEFLLKSFRKDGNWCMMQGLKEQIQYWAYPNGSLVDRRSILPLDRKTVSRYLLDISHRFHSTDKQLEAEVMQRSNNTNEIIAFSAAFDGLKNAPYYTLKKMTKKLEFLVLKGNNFTKSIKDSDNSKNKEGIAWATFPKLRALKELDISNCQIEYITSAAFRNLTNLKSLYLSHNKLLKVPQLAFSHVRNLRYLDLSNQNGLDIEFNIPLPSLEQIVNLFVGVKIEQFAFSGLSKLQYLDMSFTKLTKSSAAAFGFLPEKMSYLSLCYTSFPVIGTTLLKNVQLKGIDLSGNSFAAYSIVDDTFTSMAKSLRFLFFEQSNLKELGWIKKLHGLEILDLNGNNINSVSLEVLGTLTNLQVLDLGSNNIGNWYSQVFANNTKLKVLNLRANNINIITSEMVKDFQNLHYLGIGDNDFVCDCVLRDFVDIAIANNHKADCLSNAIENTEGFIQENINILQIPYDNPDFGMNFSTSFGYFAAVERYFPMVNKSYFNLRKQMNDLNIFNLRVITNYLTDLSTNQCPNTNQIILYDKINGSSLKFQLLDYEDIHYWCYNETEKIAFFEINCEARSFEDMIVNEIHDITNYFAIFGSLAIFISLALTVAYIKRWHIHYYWSSLKSAALLSVAAQDVDVEDVPDSNLMYDIFISYCQNDREWVLEELMPNIEIAGDLSICLHERDFEVGIPILDNIISCMDRSRSLMLLISRNFLLSHWCQFEMRLAQHRMFEASKEHLILVFLEDIPKRKRPKTLQYLMDVKTYIKWPTVSTPNSKIDEKKLFWKRLRRSLKNI